MEQPQNIKTISALLIIILILGAGFLLFTRYRAPDTQVNLSKSDSNDRKPATVVVENTLMVNGIIPVPVGFPQEIPLENGSLLESATTRYPRDNATQLSLNYQSAKTVTQKYMEYKDYMNRVGYQVTEGGARSSVRALFGTKEGANLSVALSSVNGKTLVQISYLLK
ncbi:MAG: hypothetical protein Q7K26_02840 [bacterium]|nr:hypothetical protein [bacterium]